MSKKGKNQPTRGQLASGSAELPDSVVECDVDDLAVLAGDIAHRAQNADRDDTNVDELLPLCLDVRDQVSTSVVVGTVVVLDQLRNLGNRLRENETTVQETDQSDSRQRNLNCGQVDIARHNHDAPPIKM